MIHPKKGGEALAEDLLRERYEKMVRWLDEHRAELAKTDPARLQRMEESVANIKEILDIGDQIKSQKILVYGSHDY